MSSPIVINKIKIRARKEVYIVRKLIDLNKLIPYSSLGHPVSKRVVALELYNMVLGKGELTVPICVDSANNYCTSSLVLTLIQLPLLLVMCIGMADRLSSRRGRNKGICCVIIFTPTTAVDPIV